MENNIRSLSVPKAFYTVDDISKLMSVAPNTIYTLVNNGTISSIVQTNGKLASSWPNILTAILLCFFIVLQSVFAILKDRKK